MPWTESYLRRCASVLASARSLTATTSSSGAWRAARKNTRPIRPNPLTPTRTPMMCSLRMIVEDSRRLPSHKSPDYRRAGATGASAARDADPGAADDIAVRRPGLESSSDGHHADGRRPRAAESPGTFPRRGAGGEHVVHQHDVATGDEPGALDGEGVAD